MFLCPSITELDFRDSVSVDAVLTSAQSPSVSLNTGDYVLFLLKVTSTTGTFPVTRSSGLQSALPGDFHLCSVAFWIVDEALHDSLSLGFYFLT